MIKVGVILSIPKEYKGGINYYANLLYAIKKANKDDVKMFLFVAHDIPGEYIDMFGPNCEVVKTKLLQRKSIPWFIDKIFEKVIGFKVLTDKLLEKYKIQLISHSYYVPKSSKIKTINWIPDFQYLHYPKLWTEEQLADTVKLHTALVKNSTKILLSSYDAFKDYKSAYPDMDEKAEVVHFVSQPQKPLTEENLKPSRGQLTAYVEEGTPFFYLPNQFWTHKNHMAAFQACRILKDKGYSNFKLLTSGYMKDFRNGDTHIENLVSFVKENNLEDCVKFLGLIPYEDVFRLIINADALINPSFFEGWSSTVEEAKSVGTLTLLSNIPVHIEQDPFGAKFFDPNSAEQLAQLMEDVLSQKNKYVRPSVNHLAEQLENRTLVFGQKFINLVKRLIDK